jgi:hypothetical protein
VASSRRAIPSATRPQRTSVPPIAAIGGDTARALLEREPEHYRR